MRNRSVMDYKFGDLPDVKVARSVFNRSHGWKGTFDSGNIVPIYVDTALPGDTFKMEVTSVCRMLSPLNRPVMDNMHLDFFFFSVPYRLVWNNFKRMMGEQDDPDDSIDYTIPQMTIPGGGITEGSLGDYFGLPIGVATMALPNSLHFRCYNLIWNEWFRDQNLQDSLVVDKDDGPDTLSDYTLQKRGLRYNYFNQALPNPQKGDSVQLPLGTSAPVEGIGKVDGTWASGTKSVYETQSGGATQSVNYSNFQEISGGGTLTAKEFWVERDAVYSRPNITANLSEATSSTINEWREAMALQELLEIDAKSGTRYPEWVLGHFGVSSPDARQQRSEFLGGGSAQINVTTVPQTSESGTTKQGFLAAHAHSQKGGIFWASSFTEHCLLLGFVNARVDLNYQQRLDRMWTDQTREELYVPALANLGEQVILTQELYCDGSATDDDVFGYVPRWDHLRYKISTVHGALRSDAATPLDMYHLAQDYSAAPVLNASYIEDDPPISRIQAVTSEPDWIMDCFLQLHCVRPMPVRAVPGLGRHF